jgi:hypothetical protein
MLVGFLVSPGTWLVFVVEIGVVKLLDILYVLTHGDLPLLSRPSGLSQARPVLRRAAASHNSQLSFSRGQ